MFGNVNHKYAMLNMMFRSAKHDTGAQSNPPEMNDKMLLKIKQKIAEEQKETGSFKLKIENREYIMKSQIPGEPASVYAQDRDFRVILQPKNKVGTNIVISGAVFLAVAKKKFFPSDEPVPSSSCVVM
jgi:hypothetical protein